MKRKRLFVSRLGEIISDEDVTDSEFEILSNVDMLERLQAWGYICGGTAEIKRLVNSGLATYDGAEMPDGEYGQITEQGRAYLAEHGERDANTT